MLNLYSKEKCDLLPFFVLYMEPLRMETSKMVLTDLRTLKGLFMKSKRFLKEPYEVIYTVKELFGVPYYRGQVQNHFRTFFLRVYIDSHKSKIMMHVGVFRGKTQTVCE